MMGLEGKEKFNRQPAGGRDFTLAKTLFDHPQAALGFPELRILKNLLCRLFVSDTNKRLANAP